MIKKYRAKQKNKALFFKREDKELNDKIEYLKYIGERDFDIRDWPTAEKRTISFFFMRAFVWVSRKIPVIFSGITDIYASLFFRSNLNSLKGGIQNRLTACMKPCQVLSEALHDQPDIVVISTGHRVYQKEETIKALLNCGPMWIYDTIGFLLKEQVVSLQQKHEVIVLGRGDL
jgi:hypothetical protein